MKYKTGFELFFAERLNQLASTNNKLYVQITNEKCFDECKCTLWRKIFRKHLDHNYYYMDIKAFDDNGYEYIYVNAPYKMIIDISRIDKVIINILWHLEKQYKKSNDVDLGLKLATQLS